MNTKPAKARRKPPKLPDYNVWVKEERLRMKVEDKGKWWLLGRIVRCKDCRKIIPRRPNKRVHRCVYCTRLRTCKEELKLIRRTINAFEKRWGL